LNLPWLLNNAVVLFNFSTAGTWQSKVVIMPHNFSLTAANSSTTNWLHYY
jgi:hypothetical protein